MQIDLNLVDEQERYEYLSKNFNLKVKNNGDLLGDVFIRADITATCDETGVYSVNHFGNSLIKKVEILIGKNVIDTHRSPWFQIHDEGIWYGNYIMLDRKNYRIYGNPRDKDNYK